MLKIALLVVLAAVVSAQDKRECVAPEYFAAHVVTYDFMTNYYHHGKMYYDARGEKIRFFEETHGGVDTLILYKEHKAYQVNMTTGKCNVTEENSPFRPISTGEHSMFVGDEVIGSYPGNGVVESVFAGRINETNFNGSVVQVFTAERCLPVEESGYGKYYNTDVRYHRRYYDIVTDIETPNIFNVPHACYGN